MIQLRIRTEGSFGATYAPIKKTVAHLKALGVTHAGIVDSASTWMHVRWFEECTKAGIVPILGVELVVTDTDEHIARMWFLARNTAGLSELYQAATLAHQQTVPTLRGRLPRLYRADVLSMSGDIVKFAGEVADGDFLAEAGAVIDLNPSSRLLNQKKKLIAEAHKLVVVSTSDNAYCGEDDKRIFELMSKGGLKPTPQHILPALDHQEAAQAIAKGCEGMKLPAAPMVRAPGDLEALCRAGILGRDMDWTEEYETRLRYELDLINTKDFASYFLIVADMCQFAKAHMLVGPSRGSAAGSLVCYLARITEIDPIPARLFFERFIDASRSDLPDIDLDFPDNKRDLIFEYMAKKYGAGSTAKIGNLIQFRPKAALVEVCKALNIPAQATGAVKASLIERPKGDERFDMCLQDTFEQTETGKAIVRQYPQIAYASQLEGHASHTGVHAAGLLICNAALSNFATIDANGIAQVEKHAAEVLGMLKIDVLALTTLGIIEDAGVSVDWYNLPLNDEATFDVFNSNKLSGIFQFSGRALRSLTKGFTEKTKVTHINEIDALTALARPGPFDTGVTEKYVKRAHGERFEAIHPAVAPLMADTYGLPLYQEQTMAIVREIGGFDWKETSFIRKQISKSMGKESINVMIPRFVAGAAKHGMSEADALELWEMLAAMGSYQMNKAHTFSYAVVSYWTAYLKAHHPLEFAAANLRGAREPEAAVDLLREISNEGVKFKAFDIEKSKVNWSVSDGVLIGGFLNLSGFGDVKSAKFVALRDAGKLGAKEREAIEKADNYFEDIFPMRSLYGDLYDDPDILGGLKRIEELDGIAGGSYAFLGEVVHKVLRDENEDVQLRKRNGTRRFGATAFVDFKLKDDSGTIGVRIGARDFAAFGDEFMKAVPVGAHVMVRCRMSDGIRFGFVNRWRRLDKPKAEEPAQEEQAA